MTRFLLLLLAVVCAAPVVAAQSGEYYDGLASEESDLRGVRLGIGIGPYVYDGPDILVGEAAFQDDVVSTTLGLTAEVSFPIQRQLYGRVMAGLVNIGADDDRADVVPADANPFLTSETILAEGDLMFYLTPPRRQGLAPYLFTGLSGLFATGEAAPGVSRTALALPVGLGVEWGLNHNLSLYAEASYRFGLSSVGEETIRALAAAAARVDDDVDCKDPANLNNPKCKPSCAEEPDNPDCIPCEIDPTGEGCPEVINENDSDFDTRFNSALFLGGLRLGFGSAPVALIPPPTPVPPPTPEPPPAPEPPLPPAVCELVELNTVYFDYGSGSIDRRQFTLLDENVELLLRNPACCVFIDGFTDTSEYDEFGMPLSNRRAQAVYDYYLSRGIDASRLQVRNRGVAVPNCDKEDPGPGCERNRRVESLPVDCERFRDLLDDPMSDG